MGKKKNKRSNKNKRAAHAQRMKIAVARHARAKSEFVAVSRVTALDPRFKVAYIVPHLPQDMATASPLSWYTHGLHASSSLLLLALTLPADLREMYSERSDVLMDRQLRNVWPLVTPLSTNVLLDTDRNGNLLFRVYLTNTKDVADEVDRILAGAPLPYLHVSTIPGPERVGLSEVTDETIVAYARSIAMKLAERQRWKEFAIQLNEILNQEPRAKIQHELASGMHNLTLPNEAALMAFGYTLNGAVPVSGSEEYGPQDYIDRICESAVAVSSTRNELLPEIVDHRLIVALPGIYWGHYSDWQRMASKVCGQNNKVLRLWYKAAVHPKTYVDRIAIPDDGEEEFFEEYGKLNVARALDMRCFTAGLSMLSTATLAPVLRIEPKICEVRGQLRQLALFVRSPGPLHVEWKQSRLFRSIGSDMRKLIDPRFLDQLDSKANSPEIEGLKLVGDLPLELMPSRQLSLALRYDVSRIPSMPGNAFIARCADQPVHLLRKDFSTVLIVRSFKEDDPIKDFLVKATSVQGEAVRAIIQVVDVSSEEELVNAINAYRGAMLVFDCHGAYNEDTGGGRLVIGDDYVDLWELQGKSRLPPIVIFSACDTQPIDGSHSSVATGAMAAGAKTVLATLLPIDAFNAALFIARLLFRVVEYLPVRLKLTPQVTWREFVSGMLRMSHVTETTRLLAKSRNEPWDMKKWSQIQLQSNRDINERMDDWYERFLDNYAEVMGIDREGLLDAVSKHAGLTDSMKYVQLGSPENVIIWDENPLEVLAKSGALHDLPVMQPA